MAHALSSVKIENYKSCKTVQFNLKDLTPLVGYNNAGKSNIIAAIKWLFKRESLKPDQFNDPSERIVVTGEITGLTEELLGLVGETHRPRIEPFILDGRLRLRRVLVQPDLPVAQAQLQILDPTQPESEDAWVQNPTGIENAISALFPEPIVIGAMENVQEEISKYKTTTTIGRLLQDIVGPIEAEHGAQIQATLQELGKMLQADGADRAPELVEFDDKANTILKEFFPGVSIKVHIPPPEFKEIIKDGTIKVYEPGHEEGREVSQMGHGSQRAIQMALVRYLAESKGGGDDSTARTLLLIEEPELYLHPQAIEQVRVALSNLAKSRYQVMFSTHSPQMITSDDIGSTQLIRKLDTGVTGLLKSMDEAIKEVTGTEYAAQMQVLFSLNTSSQWLFSNSVFLVEGKTEVRLIPPIFHDIVGETLGQRKIAYVPIGGVAGTRKTLRVLATMGLPSKAVVDLDYIMRSGVKEGFVEENDADWNALRELLVDICKKEEINLDSENLPTKTGNIPAKVAFQLLGANTDAVPLLANLHKRLLGEGIWFWQKGEIEDHLGLEGKSEEHWGHFKKRLQEEGSMNCIDDYAGVKNLVDWIAGT